MSALFKKPHALVQKIGANLRLARRDPEQFGRNLAQFISPDLFQARLMDVIHTTQMHARYSDSQHPASCLARLNVLDASWSPGGMTGGPNTVINLACRVAKRGVAVRLVSTADHVRLDPAWFRGHAQNLIGETIPDIEIVSAADQDNPLDVGPRDLFLATHWRTAQQLKAVLPALPIRQFFYMLQDFEPGFYSWSSNYALAVETFGLDFWPIINEASLAEYILGQPFGRLADPATRERAMIFEPAVDRRLFHPPSGPTMNRPRRLLFYARPSGSSARNMFGLGLLALRQIASSPVFDGWEFLSIGSRAGIPDLNIGGGRKLVRAPWVDYRGYADLLREADVLLCPMLSPHTSYPVLEMAACGGYSVTNSFATKSREMLDALSPNIIAVAPTIEGFAEGTLRAAQRVVDGDARGGDLSMPADWATSLDPVAERVVEIIEQLLGDTAPLAILEATSLP